MRDPAPRRIPLGRAVAFLALLILVFPGSPLPARQAADPPERLTGEEREKLGRQAVEHNKTGIQAYQRGDLTMAVEETRQSLRFFERLYPKADYPDGHPNLANTLDTLGRAIKDQGAYGEARGYYEQALAMYEARYPKNLYPHGHTELATSLINLGQLLEAQGSYGEARGYYERALAMYEALYPKDRFPHGHPHLASSLNNLGALLQAQGSYGEARGYYERALAMRQALYPRDRFPQGHSNLAKSLNNLGALLQAQGSYGEARGYYERALAMRQALYPRDRFPHGHPHLASSLGWLGSAFQAQGSYGEARGYYERALAMDEALYPKDRFPHGHPDLATSLNNLGALLRVQGSYGEAQGYYEQAQAMRRALYPRDRYPQGHPDLATSLNNLGELLQAQGTYGEARGYLERALAMRQDLFPRDRYPQGHPDLAQSLNNLGFLLEAQGSYGEARGYLERALAIFDTLYPRDRYPQGHPDLALSLNNLGSLLKAQGSYGEARGYYERALAMFKALYPKDLYPHGHPHLAGSLDNLGALLSDQGSYGEARGYHERALAMYEAHYPKDRYPSGHPDLATSLNGLGSLLRAQGSYGEARVYYERALAMYEALYPKDRYPQGHPELAIGLNNLGALLRDQGSYSEAATYLHQAVDMQQGLAQVLLAVTSEAEAIDHLARLPLSRDLLVSVSLHLPASDDPTYRRIWAGKSAVARILRERQAAAFGQARTNSAAQRSIAAWRDTRARLARLILATADGHDDTGRGRSIQQLGAEKERLERELAAALPEFATSQALERSSHQDLLKVLPEGTTVLDLVRFTRFEQDPQIKGRKGVRTTPGYVGFVLSRGHPVRMVDLGPAGPIEDAVGQWHLAIRSGQESPVAVTLRRLAWEPLSRHLPADTTTVIIAPDGYLCYIPWAAPPGDRPGTVLLEQYALATVPHAPFLLERPTAPGGPKDRSASGILLAVGGVAYDQDPRPIDDEKTRLQLLAARPAETGRGSRTVWSDLPGTLQELDAVTRLAATREVVRLQGAEAGTARLLQELPRARWAHIATHGFFANPSVRSVLSPDPRLFTSMGTANIGAGLRNPLVLSGIVLAGANRPQSKDDTLAHDDRGILTAEAIAGLPLQDLDLVVLSACETGVGVVFGGGEGVFGLQRAFHLAGAHNVVASLWRVDDQATAALMALFYERLWHQNKPPVEALREAQLTLYHHPELVGQLAKARGTPDFDKLVQRPEPGPSNGEPVRKDRAPVKQWAAFVLSGWGH